MQVRLVLGWGMLVWCSTSKDKDSSVQKKYMSLIIIIIILRQSSIYCQKVFMLAWGGISGYLKKGIIHKFCDGNTFFCIYRMYSKMVTWHGTLCVHGETEMFCKCCKRFKKKSKKITAILDWKLQRNVAAHQDLQAETRQRGFQKPTANIPNYGK